MTGRGDKNASKKAQGWASLEQYGGSMKSIKVDLPETIKEIQIHTFADLHLGDKQVDYDLITERLRYVSEKPNCYLILNGDLLNNATKTSVSDSYAEEIPPMEQIETAVKMFEPYKDRILCINSGNHESRTYNKEGINLMEIVAMQLGLHDRFSRASSLIFLSFGFNDKQRKISYTIYANHGSGGGRKEGAKAIRLADMASIVDADIYIHSHTHLPIIMKQSFFRTDMHNSTVAVVDKLFVNTGATLNYGGYGEVFEFKPASKETPVIKLGGTKKQFYATL